MTVIISKSNHKCSQIGCVEKPLGKIVMESTRIGYYFCLTHETKLLNCMKDFSKRKIDNPEDLDENGLHPYLKLEYITEN